MTSLNYLRGEKPKRKLKVNKIFNKPIKVFDYSIYMVPCQHPGCNNLIDVRKVFKND